MKESFILFTEYKEQIDMLSDEQAGILLKAIFCYSAGEELPLMDALTQMAFSFIRAAIDRTDDKYQRKVESNRENGKLGGRPPKNKDEGEEKPKNNPNKPKKPNGYLGFEEKEQEKTQKPNGYFENPPEPYPERDPVRDSEPERGESNARTREDTPMERFLQRWGINSNSIGNYSGGKLAGMDWNAVSDKTALSVKILQKRKDIGFFIKHYEEILDGAFDDWDEPSNREKKVDPDHDASRFAGIVYE